jgi:hypothetical protein
MKKFGDLTKQEIRELSYEDLNHYIELQCAVEGLPLSVELADKPEIKSIEKFTPVSGYKISGDFLFENLEDANEVLNLIMNKNLVRRYCDDYNFTDANGRSVHYLKTINSNDYSYPEIRTESALREENHSVAKVEYNKQKEAIENYNKKYKKYQEAKKEREEIESKIETVWKYEIKHLRELEDLEYLYERYLKLANQDKKTALVFLKEGYSGSYDVMEEFLEKNSLSASIEDFTKISKEEEEEE